MHAENRYQLLQEAIELVRYSDIPLADHTPEQGIDPLKDKAIALLEGLKKEKVEFSPKLEITLLNQGDSLSDIEPYLLENKGKAQNYFFYKIDIPITLKSAPDWSFTSLACNLVFSPNEEERKVIMHLPIVHDIFPSDKWQSLFSYHSSLSLGIDESLSFNASTESSGNEPFSIIKDSLAEASLQGKGSIGLKFGPFSYQVRKAIIKSRGRGNSQAFWEFQGAEYVGEQEIDLNVILMVSKMREEPIDVIGALEVNHDFQVWSADLLKFKRFLAGTIQKFLEGGATIQTTQVWKDITQAS
jgi:hypothetical protein